MPRVSSWNFHGIHGIFGVYIVPKWTLFVGGCHGMLLRSRRNKRERCLRVVRREYGQNAHRKYDLFVLSRRFDAHQQAHVHFPRSRKMASTLGTVWHLEKNHMGKPGFWSFSIRGN